MFRNGKMVFVSHIYQGKKENKNRLEELINFFSKEYPKDVFVSGVHCFDFIKCGNDIEMCLRLLKCCDLLLVCDDYTTSNGVMEEIKYAKENNIPIIYYNTLSE